MQIHEMQEKDNEALEQIIKHSLESVGLDIPGTAYFNPQLRKLAQFYRQEKGAKY